MSWREESITGIERVRDRPRLIPNSNFLVRAIRSTEQLNRINDENEMWRAHRERRGLRSEAGEEEGQHPQPSRAEAPPPEDHEVAELDRVLQARPQPYTQSINDSPLTLSRPRFAEAAGEGPWRRRLQDGRARALCGGRGPSTGGGCGSAEGPEPA